MKWVQVTTRIEGWALLVERIQINLKCCHQAEGEGL